MKINEKNNPPGDAFKKCIVCGNKMQLRVSSWTCYCRSCEYWHSTLDVQIDDTDSYLYSNERGDEKIISFLDHIRKKNFSIILNNLESIFSGQKIKILDVGCASGLFLNAAKSKGHYVMGIEPNSLMAAIANKDGHNVINGFFPEALSPVHNFNVIIFNDVFEHIPDIENIANSCQRYLTRDGVVVINLPNSNGVIFRVAKLFYKIGISMPWNRLWQKMFNTPHLHYFNPGSLKKFFNKLGYSQIKNPIMLDTYTIDGLWERLSVDQTVSRINKSILYIFIVSAIPVLNLFQKDAFFAIFKKN